MPAPRWLLCRRRRPEAALRLYCFPHSGGSPGEFVRWADDLPETEVHGVQPPGRGGRAGEAPLRSMPTLVRAFLDEVAPVAPFAFFGHSLGALVAFETARALRAAGRRTPDLLVVSALGAPQVQPFGTPTHRLDDEGLMAAVSTDAVPAAVREDPGMRRGFLACLRADAEILDTYDYTAAPPLGLPIVALGGTEDPETAHLSGWAAHSSAPFGEHHLPGGHFAFREHHDDVLGILRAALARAATADRAG